ncbi:disintegrin and metalloproteinase domain-containing protein 10-like [Ditylenchus destructor]|nr:disintegrin and metalloproteinase domain-containing protein 10-like [Ditylenchus destructor]
MHEKFLDKFLANYQPLNYTPLSQERLRDSTAYFNVTVYDRQFNLLLYKHNLTDSPLSGVDPKMFNSNNSLYYYNGEVMNDIVPPASEITGTIANGLFYGTIALCNTTTYKFLIVDRDMPAATETVPFHSVAYRQYKDLSANRPDFSNCNCKHRECYCHSPLFIHDQVIPRKCIPDDVSDLDTVLSYHCIIRMNLGCGARFFRIPFQHVQEAFSDIMHPRSGGT